MYKSCKVCNITDNKENFPITGQKNGKQTYRNICKPCYSLHRSKISNTDDYRKKQRERYHSISEETRHEKCQQKYAKHKDILSEKRKTDEYRNKTNAYLKQRRDTDKEFTLVNNYRNRISSALKSPKNTYHSFLNCSTKQFLDWIYYQLDDSLKIEDYGKEWVLDHVIPIAKCNLSNKQDIEMCFSWFNIRPYDKTLNIKKSDKIYWDEIKDHEYKIQCYIKKNSWYQGYVEIYSWLRNKELRYGKNPSKLDNPQPSS